MIELDVFGITIVESNLMYNSTVRIAQKNKKKKPLGIASLLLP